jgi:hypothetical protein
MLVWTLGFNEASVNKAQGSKVKLSEFGLTLISTSTVIEIIFSIN